MTALAFSHHTMPTKQGIHLQIQDLNKSFGTTQVLHDINISINPGEFVAIIGKSGCGKSTLLRLVAGLEDITSGSLTLDQQPVHGINPAVRIMFQDARLLPWKKVQENVGLGFNGNWRHRASEMLTQVGLLYKSKDWPATLSGGQRQRVALARALVHEPRLLLLDEPLGALDALTRIEMQALIERLWQEQGFTALLVTHDVSEAVALADRIILLEAGSVALDVPINLSRPRRRGNAEFAALEERILKRVLGSTYGLTAV